MDDDRASHDGYVRRIGQPNSKAVPVHRLFAPIDAARTRLIVALALVSVVISFVAELNQFAILSLVADDSADADGVQQQVRLLLELHRTSVLLAQIFWGLWLMITAFVILRSRMLPKWLASSCWWHRPGTCSIRQRTSSELESVRSRP